MKRLAMVAICAVVLAGAVSARRLPDYRDRDQGDREGAERQTVQGWQGHCDIDHETIVTRDKKKVNRAELKMGGNVVVDTRGDSLEELLVIEVRLVAATPTKKF